jgi:hypothetical protein
MDLNGFKKIQVDASLKNTNLLSSIPHYNHNYKF